MLVLRVHKDSFFGLYIIICQQEVVSGASRAHQESSTPQPDTTLHTQYMGFVNAADVNELPNATWFAALLTDHPKDKTLTLTGNGAVMRSLYLEGLGVRGSWRWPTSCGTSPSGQLCSVSLTHWLAAEERKIIRLFIVMEKQEILYCKILLHHSTAKADKFFMEDQMRLSGAAHGHRSVKNKNPKVTVCKNFIENHSHPIYENEHHIQIREVFRDPPMLR